MEIKDQNYYLEKLRTFPNDWNIILAEEKNKDYFKKLIEKISTFYQSETIYPNIDDVYKALELTSFENTKVLILGQDPYINVNQAEGLAFSVKAGGKFPPTLKNIFKELENEYKYNITKSTSLVGWANQGVLLLNSILTVKEGVSLSHKNMGWETFTDSIIKKLNLNKKNIVYLLWGNNAIKKKNLIDENNNLVIATSHPSPLSARHSFFNSNCFIKCNEYLKQHNKKQIDWKIE